MEEVEEVKEEEVVVERTQWKRGTNRVTTRLVLFEAI